jgi:hypothetical protein
MIEKKLIDAVNAGDRSVMRGLLLGCFGEEARDFFLEICVDLIASMTSAGMMGKVEPPEHSQWIQ